MTKFNFHYRTEYRVNRSNQVSVPHTTDATVIFPQVNGTFDKNYTPANTDGRVSAEQVNEVIDFVDNVVKQHLAVVNCLALALLAGFLFGFICLFFNHDSYTQRNIMISLFVIGVPLLCVTAVVRQKRVNQARAICQQHLDMQNQRLSSVGCRWALPVHFPMWIELHNDFKGAPGYQVNALITPTIVIPQANPFGTQQFPQAQVQFQQPQAQVQFVQPGVQVQFQQPQAQVQFVQPGAQVQFQQPQAQVQFQQPGFNDNYYNPPQQFNQPQGF